MNTFAKILIPIPICSMLTACQWIVTHPAEDAEIVKIVEEAVLDIYHYEAKQPLTPGEPPMKLEGASGPE